MSIDHRTDDKQKQRNFERKITPAEADRAIYIDFEGFVSKPPSIVGVLIESKFQRYSLDDQLSEAANFSGLVMRSDLDWASELINLAAKEHRRIVAFSSHEKNIFLEFYQLDISPFYADARMIAKQIRKTLDYPVGHPPKDLKSYLTAIDFPRGSHLGEKKSTSRLKAVIDMLKRKKDYQALTPVVKAKWTKLLDHNKIDVLGMKALVLRAIEIQCTNVRRKV